MGGTYLFIILSSLKFCGPEFLDTYFPRGPRCLSAATWHRLCAFLDWPGLQGLRHLPDFPLATPGPQSLRASCLFARAISLRASFCSRDSAFLAARTIA